MEVASYSDRRGAPPRSGVHSHTEVRYTHGGGGEHRANSCAGSCFGAGIGVLLIAASTVGLWWNEGVAVRTAASLAEADRFLSHLPAEEAPSGSLVHTSGPMRTHGDLADDDDGTVTRPPDQQF